MQEDAYQGAWEPFKLSVSEEEYLFLLALMNALPEMDIADEELKSKLEKGQGKALERQFFRINPDGEMEMAIEIVPIAAHMSSYDLCFHLTEMTGGRRGRRVRLSQKGKVGMMVEEFLEGENEEAEGKRYELLLLPDAGFIFPAMSECFGETKNQESRLLWEMEKGQDWEQALEKELPPQAEKKLWIVEGECPSVPKNDFKTLLYFSENGEIEVDFQEDKILASRMRMEDYLSSRMLWKRMAMGEPVEEMPGSEG